MAPPKPAPPPAVLPPPSPPPNPPRPAPPPSNPATPAPPKPPPPAVPEAEAPTPPAHHVAPPAAPNPPHPPVCPDPKPPATTRTAISAGTAACAAPSPAEITAACPVVVCRVAAEPTAAGATASAAPLGCIPAENHTADIQSSTILEDRAAHAGCAAAAVAALPIAIRQRQVIDIHRAAAWVHEKDPRCPAAANRQVARPRPVDGHCCADDDFRIGGAGGQRDGCRIGKVEVDFRAGAIIRLRDGIAQGAGRGGRRAAIRRAGDGVGGGSALGPTTQRQDGK